MEIPAETEYNTLRDEIINEMGYQNNLRTTMCTIVVAIFTFAIEFENPIMFLAVYVVIIPFQLLSRAKQLGILRISAYLIVKFESKNNNLSWETDAISVKEHAKSNKVLHFNLGISRLGYYISVILCAIAFIGNMFFSFKAATSFHFLIFNITVSFICVFTSVFLEASMNSNKIRSEYIKEFRNLIS